ncbi:orotidine-5'-phosphate decarboxylase [Micromonospora sp. WMMD1082]|uniref:orotidine-5'-phosphate decarboxylase n=1 Tax=Micromonospora sp. WMMD1082 TaxID=3016104 RepID=UPI002416B0CE|nr:orotidine-5'-phosphate decarboxylase [Micromonospora sp. WMMD1082]MDG4797043.1 orotidine-5'-phosphate decarboxylase [Micromonospora sp. WMMD1082]
MTLTRPGTSFAGRWSALSAQRGGLCLGVAPSPAWLQRWGLADSTESVRRYGDVLLDAAGDTVAGYKIQTPFYLRHGAAGMAALRRFRDGAHERGALVLLDAKIGDADDTMAAYADLYLGPQSQLGGDAVTACAFMGAATLHPLLRIAQDRGAAVFTLVRTSNHGAGEVQGSRTPDGHSTAEAIADALTAWHAEHCGTPEPGPAAAVVGARLPESVQLVRRLPHSVLEIPGLGRADRRTEEVLTPVRDATDRAMLTVTTGVLRHGPVPAALRAGIRWWQEEIARHR